MTSPTKADLATVNGGQGVVWIYNAFQRALHPTCERAQRHLADVQAMREHRPALIPTFVHRYLNGVAEQGAQRRADVACQQ
jgi:hypothetical protein